MVRVGLLLGEGGEGEEAATVGAVGKQRRAQRGGGAWLGLGRGVGRGRGRGRGLGLGLGLGLRARAEG